MSLRLLEPAEQELDEAIAYYNAQVAGLGDSFLLEALKYGLPLEDVLDVIMDSNESKLGADGNPIYDANGKFLKGPYLSASERQ